MSSSVLPFVSGLRLKRIVTFPYFLSKRTIPYKQKKMWMVIAPLWQMISSPALPLKIQKKSPLPESRENEIGLIVNGICKKESARLIVSPCLGFKTIT
jgi:hypothetical protein